MQFASYKRQLGLIRRQLHTAPRRKIVNSTSSRTLPASTVYTTGPHSTELQRSLNWQPLRTRRRNIIYNIVNNLSRIPHCLHKPPILPPPPPPPPRHLRNKTSSTIPLYLFSLPLFFMDVIPIWNSFSGGVTV